MATESFPAPAAYPVRLEIAIPEGENRWMILIRWLLALPHYIVQLFLGLIQLIATFIAWWAILFTGRYPRGIFDFNVGVLRWAHNVNAYVYFHNAYPPFALADGEYDPVSFDVERAERYSRWKLFLKWLFVIPHIFALYVVGLAAAVAFWFVWWAVLITGRYPPDACGFITGYWRWNARVSAYAMLLVDDYPPFSLA